MAKASIMLAWKAKETPKKLKDDTIYQVSEKLDGVPVDICWKGDDLIAVTRQGNRCYSIPHILHALRDVLPYAGKITGELYIPNMKFQQLNGITRRDVPDGETLQLNLMLFPEFSSNITRPCDHVFSLTYVDMKGSLLKQQFTGEMFTPNKEFFFNVIHEMVNAIDSPYCEGFIARDMSHPWEANKRSAGYLKLVYEEMLDLKVVDVLPMCKPKVEGEPQDFYDMVGSFTCEWTNPDGTLGYCKVGAGTMKHPERAHLWDNKHEIVGKIILVKYKPDAGYIVPRQATYQGVRDKDEYDITF